MALVQSKRIVLPILMLFSSLGLAACSTTNAALPLGNHIAGSQSASVDRTAAIERYGKLSDEKFPVPAINVSRIDDRYLRQFVDFETADHPGTIVIDTDNRFLYLVQEHGKAIRYGIGVGVSGLEFTGRAAVGYKRMWPRWTPTANMIRRNPRLYERWRGGMEAGPDNPLGARALYLFKDGKDTLYRIHGTAEPHTIGKAVSSGCIRMFNHDVIDLYQRVPAGARVVVLGGRPPSSAPLSSEATPDARSAVERS